MRPYTGRFACQLTTSASIALLLPSIYGDDVRNSFPKGSRCSAQPLHVPPAHPSPPSLRAVRRCASVTAGACEHSGLPALGAAAGGGGGGAGSLGAVLNEALHTAALGIAIGLTAPRLGALAVGAAVVAVIRSPFAATGPALNLGVPSSPPSPTCARPLSLPPAPPPPP
jgi:hypothetical protein